MCGICGVLRFDGAPVSSSSIVTMCDAIRHRGPDDQGYYAEGVIGLGMRRLSIIDLSSGHQPIWNEAGTVCIVFNGEIYNYSQLRSKLLARSHVLRTNSDTEVIVHLYEDLGIECVHELDGMFAFAIWDLLSQQLFVARDRLGEKPLYYAKDGKQLIFASELKALLAYGVPRTLDLEALYYYFTFMTVPAPLSIFQSVRKLLPGHLLTCDQAGQFETQCYWDITDWDTVTNTSETEREEQLLHLLRQAVEERLMADVPLGALLSGGLDSSLIVALMSRSLDRPVRTFSVGFEGDRYFDELPYARRVASILKTEHHEIIVRPDVRSVLPQLVWHWDEPFGVSSAVPTYFISEAAREHVKVVLTGDGGDELFAGYPRYRWDTWADRLGPLGPAVGHATNVLLKSIAKSNPTLRRADRFARSLTMERDARYSYYLTKFDFDDKRNIFSTELVVEFERLGLTDASLLGAYYSSFTGKDSLNRRIYGDIKTSLVDEMLTKVDKMSMAASLEARSPLLDYQLIEFAAKLPVKDKLHGSEQKYLLRRIARRFLPKEIIDRPKHGFEVPVGQWLRGELRSFAEDVLLSRTARQRGIWQPKAVENLWDRHIQGESGLGERIWILLIFELWCQETLSNSK